MSRPKYYKVKFEEERNELIKQNYEKAIAEGDEDAVRGLIQEANKIRRIIR